VTLSKPNSFPTVCVTLFEDLTGCPWVLKTLQATKLKLKMDQNEKTTCGLMEFYHRHIMWNATLVAPGILLLYMLQQYWFWVFTIFLWPQSISVKNCQDASAM